jgi:hypothetical protein
MLYENQGGNKELSYYSLPGDIGRRERDGLEAGPNNFREPKSIFSSLRLAVA